MIIFFPSSSHRFNIFLPTSAAEKDGCSGVGGRGSGKGKKNIGGVFFLR